MFRHFLVAWVARLAYGKRTKRSRAEAWHGSAESVFLMVSRVRKYGAQLGYCAAIQAVAIATFS